MAKPETAEMPKPKSSISLYLSSEQVKGLKDIIRDLSLGDEIIVHGSGILREMRKNQNDGKPETYSVQIDLDKVDLDPVGADDKVDADKMGMSMKDYKKLKKMKEGMKEKMEV